MADMEKALELVREVIEGSAGYLTKSNDEVISIEDAVILAHALIATLRQVRHKRQKRVHEWCIEAFGGDHARSITQRGIRLAEEAIEAAQSAGCDPAMVHRLVDHVYSKQPGVLSQEIGGVGVTLLALAQAAGVDAEAEEVREFERVLSKPLAHFAARNKAKNDAGFNVAAGKKQVAGEKMNPFSRGYVPSRSCACPAEHWEDVGPVCPVCRGSRE